MNGPAKTVGPPLNPLPAQEQVRVSLDKADAVIEGDSG